jgi:hypothetical protein
LENESAQNVDVSSEKLFSTENLSGEPSMFKRGIKEAE